jgi:hypothetical protein
MAILNCEGDWFNIEAVRPGYMPECQHAFTWYRDKEGVAIVSGYDPEFDPDVHWLCWCGHFETGGGRCTNCGNDAPWGGDDGYEDEYDYVMLLGDDDQGNLE